jgi:hypothetical protein
MIGGALRFLRAAAVWLVVAAWLLFLGTGVVALSASVGASINAFYFPYHPQAPLDRATTDAFICAVAASLFAAVGSSIALAFKRRLIASSLVVTIWIGLLVYSRLALSDVKPGPEHFERYLAAQIFRIPWQYGFVQYSQHAEGFDVMLCLSTLQGQYGQNCSDRTIVMVWSREGGFTSWGKSDERNWRSRISEMKQDEPHYGHDTYVQTRSPDAQGRVSTTWYYVRHDSEGRLARLVVCEDLAFRKCKHHALVDRYSLSFDANDSAFPTWETTDRGLADLINSWRVL